MSTRTGSALVSLAAVVAAVIVEVIGGGDPTPYLGLASLGLGYAAGHTVASKGKSKG